MLGLANFLKIDKMVAGFEGGYYTSLAEVRRIRKGFAGSFDKKDFFAVLLIWN
jgi:hypothetical protein